MMEKELKKKKGTTEKEMEKKACYFENYINQQNKTKRTTPFSSSLHLSESALKMYLANMKNFREYPEHHH